MACVGAPETQASYNILCVTKSPTLNVSLLQLKKKPVV